MKKFLILTALSLTACPWDKTPLCDAQKNTATLFATVVATNFGCKKVDVIAADFNKALEPLKLCDSVKPTGPVADLVCPPMVKFAVSQGLNVLPTTWECTGGTATDKLAEVLTNLCKTIPY